MKKVLGVVIMLTLVGCTTEIEISDSDRYLGAVDKVKKRMADADFTSLRMVYTNTVHYKPFGGKEKLLLNPMFKAFQKGDFKICLNNSKEILDSNYPSLNGHYAAMICQYKLGNREKGDYHKYVLDGLVASINQSGNGKSKDTPYVVISPPEMKAFLDLKGLTVRRRNLDRDRGKAYNIMSVTNQKTGKRYDVIFDVTIQLAKGI